MNWISAAIGAVLTAVVAFGLHSGDMYFVNKAHEKELREAKALITAACESQKSITAKVDDDYKTIIDLGHELDDAHGLLNIKQGCIAFTGAPASVDNGAASGGKSVGQSVKGYSVVPAQHYVDIAAMGEKYRRQLKGCQKYIILEQQK